MKFEVGDTVNFRSGAEFGHCSKPDFVSWPVPPRTTGEIVEVNPEGGHPLYDAPYLVKFGGAKICRFCNEYEENGANFGWFYEEDLISKR